MIRTTFLFQDEYITMTRGDTLAFGIEIFDQDGQALDIDTIYLTCRKNYTDPPVFQKFFDKNLVFFLQKKEALIKENGIYSVTPDSGYDGLSSVVVSIDRESGGEGAITVISTSVLDLNESGIKRHDVGQYTVRVAPADTRNLEAGKYVYDLQIGKDDDIYTLKKGILEIEHDVTY